MGSFGRPPWMWLVVSTSILLVLGWKVRHPFMAMYRERVPGYAKLRA